MSLFKRCKTKETTFPCACPYCGNIVRYFAFLLPATEVKKTKLTGNSKSGDLVMVDQKSCPDGYSLELLREHEDSMLPTAANLKSMGQSIRLKRVCPHCYNELYSSFGMLKQKSISIVGFRGSGKTTYLCALYGRLIANSSFTFFETNTKGLADNLKILEENSKDLHDRSTGCETPEDAFKWVATSEVSDPYIFWRENDMFSIRDIPGEYFDPKNAERLRTAGNYIRSSDAMIFIIDFGHIDEAINVLQTLNDSFGNLSIETAFVITKKDLIQSEMDIPPYSSVWETKNYTNGQPVNLREINNRSAEIRKTIVEKKCPRLLSFIDKSNFNGTWFISGVFSRDGNFNTCGLEESFLWLLGKLGMYPIEGG